MGMVHNGLDLCCWVVFNLVWSISADQAKMHCSFMEEHFGVHPVSQRGYLFPYHLDRNVFVKEFNKLKKQRGTPQISFQPPMDNPLLIHRYIQSPEKTITRNTFCYKQWIRADIMPDGNVVSCKEFPDYIVGDLKQDSIFDIWNSDRYRCFRKVISERLTPVCSKCDALGWYSKRR